MALAALAAQELDLRRAANLCNTSGENTSAAYRGNGGMLELTTAFTANGQKRAVWNLPFNKDLGQCAGIMLDLYCTGHENASQFNLYVKTDGKWHNAQFEVNGGKWESVFIPKSHFSPENGMSSWTRCTTLRIAAWNGRPGRLSLFLSRVEIVRHNASVAVIRGAGEGNQKRAAESLRYARNFCDALHMHGLRPAVIDEADMAFTTIRPYSLVAVPSCDGLSPASIDTLIQYMRAGGKAGFFHALPPKIAAQLGTPTGKYTAASSIPGAIGGMQPDRTAFPDCRMVRQMSTAFISVAKVPPGGKAMAWWADGAGAATRYPAIISTRQGFWMTHVFLNQDPLNGGRLFVEIIDGFAKGAARESASCLLADASKAISFTPAKDRGMAPGLISSARAKFKEGEFGKASALCIEGLEALKGSGTARISANPNEMRAIWCRYPEGLPGFGWKKTMEILAGDGMTAVFPIAASPFQASYESRLVSRARGEGLPECIAAAKTTGICVHAWVNCLGIEDAPESVIKSFAAKGQLQLDSRGRQLPWLCPNDPENKRLLSRLVSELVSKHNVDGVHFDRIRYPGKDSCFCTKCRKAFEDYAGAPMRRWPDDAANGDFKSKWTEFRVASINSLLSSMTQSALAAKKGTYISVAVYPDSAQARVNVGQDWAAWCRKRQVSFACPMNYHSSTSQFQADIRRQIQQTGKPGMLVPGIGTGPMRMSADELSRQINATRAEHTYGFIVFDLGQREAFELLKAK